MQTPSAPAPQSLLSARRGPEAVWLHDVTPRFHLWAHMTARPLCQDGGLRDAGRSPLKASRERVGGPRTPGWVDPTGFAHPLLFPLGGPGQVWLDVAPPPLLSFRAQAGVCVWSRSETFVSRQKSEESRPRQKGGEDSESAQRGDHLAQDAGGPRTVWSGPPSCHPCGLRAVRAFSRLRCPLVSCSRGSGNQEIDV